MLDTPETTDSRPTLALIAALVAGTLEQRGTSRDFRGALQEAIELRQGYTAPTLEGIDLVPCRRCGGTGVYHTQRGPDVCAGHGMCGVCRGGKSLNPAGRVEWARRQVQANLDALRACWARLADLAPTVTHKRDARDLVRQLRQVEFMGRNAADHLARLAE